MKKQQKKAFTLVELLVVIAILAILASVAVVGYTAFIKNAAVSNDENVVAQMNRYLEALKADDQDLEIGEDNIAWLLAELVDAGLESVEPYALKYGYHYYFNKSEQKFVLEDNEGDALDIQVARHFSLRASADGEENTRGFNSLSPYAAFTKAGYLFADLGGDWADLVKKFKEVKTLEDLETLHSGASNMAIGNQNVTGLQALVEATVFVTENGNLVKDVDGTHNNVVVQQQATGEKFDEEGNTLFEVLGYKQDANGTKTIDEANPLFVPVEENQNVELPADVTYVATEFLSNVVSSEAKVEVDGVQVEVNVTVTIKKETVDEIKDILDQGTDTTQINVTVVNTSGVTVEVKTTVTENDDGTVTTTTSVKVGDEEKLVPNRNTVTDFTLGFEDSAKSTVIDDVRYIAWDGGQFTFTTSDFVGKIANQPVIEANKALDWTWVVKGDEDEEGTSGVYHDYVTVENGVLTLDAKGGDAPAINEIVVTATTEVYPEGEEGVSKTYTLKVVRVTAINGLQLAGKNWANKTTLVNAGSAVDYAITYTDLSYNQTAATNLCDTSITWSYYGGGTTAEEGTTTVSAQGEGNGQFTLKVGPYVTHTTTLSIFDDTQFPIQAKNNYTIMVGNGNAVKASDLFVGTEIPADAVIKVYWDGTYTNDTYMNPVRPEVPTSGEGLTVNAEEYSLASGLANAEIQFTGTSESLVSLAVVQNGVRISNYVTIKLVAGYNVRNYTDLTSNVNTTADKNGNYSYPLTSNVVFLDNITMSGDVNFLQIPADKTLYGNGFKFDIMKGRDKEEGIINLKGTLRDIMIIGRVYQDFKFSVTEDNSSSAVNATGNAYIYNSYIANTRSPLRTSGAGVVIEDSVLFGGRYSNIDMTGGTITIRGTVTTVQQVYSVTKENNGGTAANNVIGMGVSAWFNDGKKNVVIEEGANFVQYNFMNESISQYLPPISVLGLMEVMDLKEPFNAMFNDTATYGKYMFTATNGNKYVNSGIVSTDKYMLNYTIGGDEPSGGILGFGANYAVGAKKIVKVTTAVNDTDEFTVVYDTKFTPSVGEVIKAGYVKVTGAQLKAGVEFVVNTKITSTDGVSYSFQIQSDDYLTVNVSGAGSTGEYNELTYNFSKDMSGTLGSSVVNLAVKMHDKGIHYGKMCVGVNTPVSTAYAYGTTTYQQLLEQYIEMTDGDGEGDNFYTPENFQFVNGSVTNYWD